MRRCLKKGRGAEGFAPKTSKVLQEEAGGGSSQETYQGDTSAQNNEWPRKKKSHANLTDQKKKDRGRAPLVRGETNQDSLNLTPKRNKNIGCLWLDKTLKAQDKKNFKRRMEGTGAVIPQQTASKNRRETWGSDRN